MERLISMVKRFVVLASLVFLIMSCEFNSTFINREEHKKEAEIITNQFFGLKKDNAYDKMYPLFSKRFWEISDTAKVYGLYRITFQKLGSFENARLDKWETKVVKGSKAASNYALQYTVKYQHFEATETFNLEKENDQIKITNYHIVSKGFVESDFKDLN